MIVEKIFELMKKENLTQKELARKIGVTEASMSRYLKGEREPKIKVLIKIAHEFGVSTDYLLGLDYDKLVMIGLTKSELKHCINDLIAYCNRLEGKNFTIEELTLCGYYSRKRLIEKLMKLEQAYFPILSCCG